MAYDKIIPIRRRLDHCVSYVLNPEKTDLGRVLEYISNAGKTITPDGKAILETAINCQSDTAYQEMQATKRRWGKTGGVLGYHLVHSYAPGEVTPEQAHEIGVEFARQLLQDRYEAVVSTHLDHAHIHNHVLFNSVSCIDGKKYRDDFKAYYSDIRGISNALSRKHGLSVIQPEGGGKSYAEWEAEKQGKSTIRGLIRQDIDAVIRQSFTYATFLSVLRKQGYEIKYGPNVKHTAVKPPGSSRFIRLSSLGEGYSEAEIKERLSAGRTGRQSEEVSVCAPTTSPVQSRRYRVVRGNIQSHKRSKATGFRALYLYYMYFLGIRQPAKQKKPVPFSVRKEVTRLHRYQQQFQLLQTYHIDTADQLSMLMDALQAEMDALALRRKALYGRRKQGEAVTNEIDEINQTLRLLRRNLKLCAQIEVDIPRIGVQSRFSREQQIQKLEKEVARNEKLRHFERGK